MQNISNTKLNKFKIKATARFGTISGAPVRKFVIPHLIAPALGQIDRSVPGFPRSWIEYWARIQIPHSMA